MEAGPQEKFVKYLSDYTAPYSRRWHGVTTHMTVLSILTAVKTSNPIRL
jgi:hypothetical protein